MKRTLITTILCAAFTGVAAAQTSESMQTPADTSPRAQLRERLQQRQADRAVPAEPRREREARADQQAPPRTEGRPELRQRGQRGAIGQRQARPQVLKGAIKRFDINKDGRIGPRERQVVRNMIQRRIHQGGEQFRGGKKMPQLRERLMQHMRQRWSGQQNMQPGRQGLRGSELPHMRNQAGDRSIIRDRMMQRPQQERSARPARPQPQQPRRQQQQRSPRPL